MYYAVTKLGGKYVGASTLAKCKAIASMEFDSSDDAYMFVDEPTFVAIIKSNPKKRFRPVISVLNEPKQLPIRRGRPISQDVIEEYQEPAEEEQSMLKSLAKTIGQNLRNNPKVKL